MLRKKSPQKSQSMDGMNRYWNRFTCSLLLLFVISIAPHVSNAQTLTAAVPLTGQPPYRTGELVRVRGTGLNINPCNQDTLILTWSVPTSRTLKLGRSPSGTASATNFATSTNGTVDTIKFLMPAAVHCGNLNIALKKYASGCSTFTTVNLPSPITVGNKAIMNYPNGGVFCLNDTNGLPTKSEAGTFSSPTISAAFLSPTTGRIIIHSGLIGSHRINFVADQDSNIAFTGCADATFDSIEIRPNGPVQNMSYPPGPFCGASPSFIALSSLPAVVGTFSSSPAGLWVDPQSGSIRPDSSTTGTYLVTFTPEHDACSSPIFESVEIDSVRQLDFSYLTGICAFDSGLAPVITRNYDGGFSAAPLFGAVGVLGVDSVTGVLDASGVSSGTFEVIFVPDTSVDCQATTRVVVTVVALPDPTFFIASDSACRNGANVALNVLVTATSDTFVDRTGTVSFAAGPAIDVGAATGGPLAITHVASVTSSGVTCVDSMSQPFTVIAPQTAAINYPIMNVCAGKIDTLSPVFISGALGGTFSISGTGSPAPTINPATGEIYISPSSAAGSYTVTYNFAGSNICPGSSTIGPIVLSPEPNVDFYFGFPPRYSLTVCSNDGLVSIDTNWLSLVDSSRIDLYGSQLGSPFLPITDTTLNPVLLGAGGPYPVVLTAYDGGCASYDTIYLKVDQFYSSNFDYLDDVACQGGSNPVAHIMGYGGGVFSQVTNVNISLDSGTGEIDISVLDSINGDTLIVLYTTSNLSAICSDSTRDTIVVIGNNSADFEFNGVRFCKSDSMILYPLVPGTNDTVSGGAFTVSTITGGNLFMPDTTTGMINVALSDTGTYTISNIIQGGGCVSQFSLSIRILPGFVATSMNYADTTYCSGQPNPTPLVTGDQTGIFIGTQGINLINAQGQIDLSNSIPNDSAYYYIQYRLENSDGCVLTLVDSVKILPLDGSFFFYDPGFICSTVDTVRLDSAPTISNGTFSIRDFNNLVVQGGIDPNNGDIFTNNLDSTGFQRQFTVFFTPAPNACAQPHQQTLTLLRGPEGADIVVSPDSLFCAGTEVTISAVGILDGAWFVLNDTIPRAYDHLESFIRGTRWFDGDSVTVTLFTGELDTVRIDTGSPGNPQFINAQYPGGGYIIDESKICFVRRTVTMEVKPLPVLTLVDSVDVLTSDQPAIFGLQSSMDLTTVQWSAEDDTLPGNATYVQPGGLELFDVANTTYQIQNQVNLISPNSPAQAEYTFIPTADNCTGPPLVYQLNINPEGTDVFVPQIFTPDGDEFNETWYVQVRTGVSPDDYSLELYNRAGGLVYRMQPLVTTWDGGSLPDGVYWWNLKDRQGNSVDKGGLTIRRK